MTEKKLICIFWRLANMATPMSLLIMDGSKIYPILK